MTKHAYYYRNPDHLDLVAANDKYLDTYRNMTPKTLAEFIAASKCTGDRSVVTMLNTGPRNAEETKIMNYFIWHIAIPAIRSENTLTKAYDQQRISFKIDDADDEDDDEDYDFEG